MIGNTRQLGLSRRKLDELRSARSGITSDIDAASYDRLITTLESEIREFESIQAGAIRQFHVTSVDELGEAVVKARVASGLNQRQLAEELGVTEQAVQRDEASYYERAGLAKIAEVLDVLEHQLIGMVRPLSAGVEAQIVAYPAATQGRVDASRSDSSWTTSVEAHRRSGIMSVNVGSSSARATGLVGSAQNAIKVSVSR